MDYEASYVGATSGIIGFLLLFVLREVDAMSCITSSWEKRLDLFRNVGPEFKGLQDVCY